MAESVVKLVLEKLGDVVVKEVIAIWNVESQIERVSRELERIQAFLKDAENRRNKDERQEQWVKEVREVAYWIEDTIDTFLSEVPEKEPENESGICSCIMWMFGLGQKNLPVTRNLCREIDRILQRLQEIENSRRAFGTNDLGEDSAVERKLLRLPVLPEIEDLDVVGLGAETDEIVTQLLQSALRLSVVSIWGPGGLGKTTLAKKVYHSNIVRSKFHTEWVTISQEFDLKDVVRKIIRDTVENDRGKDEDFLTKLHGFLNDKKYLLIFDDVWTTDLWQAIKRALPDNKNGSRILLTTRFFEVAKEADPGRDPYKLNYLTDELSLRLFLKNIFGDSDSQSGCHSDLLILAREFVKKCGGLPLAIIVLGGLLAQKEPTYHVWSKALERINWYDDRQRLCVEIIGTSYHDLPLSLKSCFMYFAQFPEDHEINARRLLQMWVAEGFIPHQRQQTLEETANNFLEDLVQRSMIQVSKRSLHSGYIQECRIHDLLREVAIQKAEEDNFMKVCSTNEEGSSSGRARRLAVHNSNYNVMMKYASPNLRTLYCLNSPFPDCSRLRIIKVLTSDYRYNDLLRYRDDLTTGVKIDLIEWFEVSHQLRYLQLHEGTFVWQANKRAVFDKLIEKMRFLQSLDLRDINGNPRLPESIWHIKTLRHIMVPHWHFMLGPPPSIVNRNLHTVQSVKSRESWEPTCFPNVPNLRVLNIQVTEGSSWESVISFLRTLQKLEVLLIDGQENPIDVGRGCFQNYKHLTSLALVGSLVGETPFHVTMFPTHLTKLEVKKSNLEQGHVAVLQSFKSQGAYSRRCIFR